jgi:hypothetical protein
MQAADVLSIEGNVLKDRLGKTVAVISPELGQDVAYAYAHTFAVSSQLLEFMKDKITPLIDRYIQLGDFGKDKYARLGGHQPYTHTVVNTGFADWIKKGIQAVALAEGEGGYRSHYTMMTETELRQLYVEGNILRDDMGQVVAKMSEQLTPDAANTYARIFAASVEVLDIIDFKSGAELAGMRNEYEAALEYNKHDRLPSNVSVVGVTQPFIPAELERTRRLVTKAKGKIYKDWA